MPPLVYTITCAYCKHQVELKQKDEQYVKDLKRQAEDVDLIIDRMEEHLLQQTNAYATELDQVEVCTSLIYKL